MSGVWEFVPADMKPGERVSVEIRRVGPVAYEFRIVRDGNAGPVWTQHVPKELRRYQR